MSFDSDDDDDMHGVEQRLQWQQSPAMASLLAAHNAESTELRSFDAKKQYKGYVAQVRATEAQMGVDATQTFDFDVLRWWQRVESEHPDLKLLVRLARYSLMSSASQFPVERLFSVMRAMLSKRQSMMDLELLVARVVISEEEALCGRPSDVDD